jgi:O-antigen/teichoic acid export membrane protein
VSRGIEEPSSRRFGRAAGLVSAGIALSGLLLYGFFALASHSLTEGDYGQVVVLWLIVFALVSTLFRPVEQLLAREIATARAEARSDAHAMRSAALILAGLGATFVVVALAFRGPLRDDVFSGESVLYWALIAGVLSFGCDYYVRGVLAGRGRFDLYAAQLVTECSVLVAVGVLATSGAVEGLPAFAVGIAAAPLLGLVVVGVAVAARGLGAGSDQVDAAQIAPAGQLAHHGGFAAAVLLIMLSEQVLINAGPLFVRAGEGTAVAGFVFNLLMLARAPAALFQGIAASLLPHLAAAQARGAQGATAFRDSLRATLIGVAAFTGALVLGALTVGPPLMELVFGENFSYGRAELLAVAIGTGFLLSAATLTQSALVRGRAPAAAAAWVAAALAFCAWNLVDPLDAEWTVAIGFAAGALAAALAQLAIYKRGAVAGRTLTPGSADELQARLATAEELG